MNNFQTPKKDADADKKRQLSPGTPSPTHVNSNPQKKPKGQSDGSLAPITECETMQTDSSSQCSISKSDMENIVQIVMGSVREELKDFINDTVKAMAQSVADVVSSTINEKVKKLETSNETLSKEVSSLRSQVATLTSTCEKLQTDQDEAEQYSRRNCLRISGILESDEQTTDSIVLNIAKECDANIALSDIDRSHRLNRRRPLPNAPVPDARKDKPRDIIVKFTSYRARALMFQSKKKLENNEIFESVYINEDLTKRRSELLYNARKLKNTGAVKSAFSRDGRIFILDNQDHRHLIHSAKDLNSFRLYSNVVSSD